jgi:hypothetical protein
MPLDSASTFAPTYVNPLSVVIAWAVMPRIDHDSVSIIPGAGCVWSETFHQHQITDLH